MYPDMSGAEPPPHYEDCPAYEDATSNCICDEIEEAYADDAAEAQLDQWEINGWPV